MKLSEIPADKRLNLVFHKGDVAINNDRPDTIEITPAQTLEVARGIDGNAWVWLKEQPSFMRLLRMVFPEDQFDLPPIPLQQHGTGMQHVVGLIVLLRHAQKQGKTPFVRYPESYLHPSQQVGLADLFNAMTKPEKDHD